MKRFSFTKRFWIITSVILAALISSIAVAAISDKSATAKKKEAAELYNQVELFAEAISIIRSEYVDEVEAKKMIYGAMRGMLESLDDFSQFMDPDEYDEIRLETKGEFGGLGIEIGIRDGILTVIAPISDTPAEAAGIKAGDKIVKIDGKITKSIQLSEAVKSMRGKPGTAVTLTIWREKEGKVFDVTIKRATITVHSVKKVELIEDKTGYIKLVEFQENTPADLDAALAKLESQGIDALILDLRNNPGGLLDTAVDVSERFLPKDAVIVSIKSRDKSEDVTFKSGGWFAHLGYPMVVLVNEGSASGSEILAGAVQDNGRGLILGTKTFGKASVQTVIPLKDGSAARLTTASYLTPQGKLIRGQGIIPDLIVEKDDGNKKKSDIFEKLGDGKGGVPPVGLVLEKEKKLEPEKEDEKVAAEDGGEEHDKDKPDLQLEAAIKKIKEMKAG
ncbi:MAG TPA: S41 family peptidase, partial [Candidatus Omnitrophota bacterium]|nr:S41 family peptidase [Candidatus Omnitrophota bacterium]